MVDKAGPVLRVATVINQPDAFTVRKRAWEKTRHAMGAYAQRRRQPAPLPRGLARREQALLGGLGGGR